MAIPYEMVHGTGVTTVEDNNEWRFGEQEGGVVSVTLAPELFNVDDETLKDKYLTGLGPDATTIYIRSGIPLAQVTSGDNKGAYGPYDPNAEDGRADRIAGLLESMVAVNITYQGWDVDDVYVGLRYRGDIIKSKLPVVPADGAVWDGDFYDIEDDAVTPLSLTNGNGESTAPAAGSVTTAALSDGAVATAKLADGAATPAKLAGYDGDTGHGKLPQVKGDGSGFDFIDPGTLKAAQATPNVLGTVKQAAFVADPAGAAPTKAEYVALRDALVTAGIMAPKA